MSCHEYEEGLIDYAFGAPADASLQAHLARCAACRARLDQERGLAASIDDGLRAMLDVVPAAGFEAAVRERTKKRPARAAARTGLVAAGLGIAAALAGIVVAVQRAQNDGPPSVSRLVSEAPSPSTPLPRAATVATPASSAPDRIDPEPSAGANTTRRRVSPRTGPQLARPEVIVDPRDLAALRAYSRRLAEPVAPSTVLAAAPPPEFAPAEAQRIDELPRLSVSEFSPFEPAADEDRLVSGGDV